MSPYHLTDFPPDWPAKVLGVMTAEGAVDWSDAEIERCTSRCAHVRIGDCARAMRDADRAERANALERRYIQHGLTAGAYYTPVDPAAGSGTFLLDAVNPPFAKGGAA